MSVLYLAGLLVGIAGMVVLDLRFRLFFRRGPVRAAIVMAVGIAFFLGWDLAGIRLDVFFPGRSTIVTGMLLAPGLPLEEVVFLALLCYTTMNAYALCSGSGGRRWPSPRQQTRRPSRPSGREDS